MKKGRPKLDIFLDPKYLKKEKDDEGGELLHYQEDMDLFHIAPSSLAEDFLVEIDLGAGTIIVDKDTFDEEVKEYYEELERRKLTYHLKEVVERLRKEVKVKSTKEIAKEHGLPKSLVDKLLKLNY